MQTAYIVKGCRTAIAKAKKGALRAIRTDDFSAALLRHLLKQTPQLDPSQIDDVMVGCAMPEGVQGLNMARFIALMGLESHLTAAVTVNRYCASGIETIAMASAKIQAGMADCIIAGGAESMSQIPMGGYAPAPNYQLTQNGKASYYWNMGLTAEAVACKFNISRAAQDEFAYQSHKKAIKAIREGKFKASITPITGEQIVLNDQEQQIAQSFCFDEEECPRADTSLEALAKLKPIFQQGGTVTAGNASQMSDGAAFVFVMSERMVKQLNLKPMARLIAYETAGVAPEIMGIGPVEAIAKALKKSGLKMQALDLIELNEAFAAQSLAVIKQAKLNPEIINVNGGAIALGHPLGCTGAKLTIQLLDELRLRGRRYGMVSLCVGTGQGVAGIFEML